MWICQKCQTQNRDGMQACPVCGTMRAAGRFSSASPRVMAATTAAAPQMQEPAPSGSMRTGYQPPEENARTPRAPRRKGGGLARLTGGLLCVLLPVMILVLAWQQREILRPVLASLFTGPEAPEWLGWTCYGFLSLAAALVALLPGLWTLLLNKRK